MKSQAPFRAPFSLSPFILGTLFLLSPCHLVALSPCHLQAGEMKDEWPIDVTNMTQMRSLSTSEATRLSGEKAFAMAGVKPGDFDHIMLYDAFTSGPPIMLESLGLCKPGEGVHFFEEGRSTPGGKLPINTNGGGLSYTHSGMYGIFPIIESVRQLRGECGARQVPNVKLGLVNGMGGMLSAAGTLVLSTQSK